METIELKVAGMTCGGCEANVTRVLEKIDGVKAVDASHQRGTVIVSLEQAVERDVLATAVEDAGYDVVPDDRRSLPMA